MHDLLREGRPKDSLTSDAIAAVCRLLEEDQRLTIRQIEYIIHEEMCNPISPATVHHIVCDELAMKKVLSRWVSKQLTETYRNERMASAIDFFNTVRARREHHARTYSDWG